MLCFIQSQLCRGWHIHIKWCAFVHLSIGLKKSREFFLDLWDKKFNDLNFIWHTHLWQTKRQTIYNIFCQWRIPSLSYLLKYNNSMKHIHDSCNQIIKSTELVAGSVDSSPTVRSRPLRHTESIQSGYIMTRRGVAGGVLSNIRTAFENTMGNAFRNAATSHRRAPAGECADYGPRSDWTSTSAFRSGRALACYGICC